MIKTEVLVSIIIPVFNRESIISETLNSVLAQSYLNWECIIVDDNSIDNTQEIIDRFVKMDSRFKFIKKEMNLKKGANISRNIGLTVSKGKYIQFLDSDDILARNKLESQVSLINKYNNSNVIVTCKWERFCSVKEFSGIFIEKEEYKSFDDTNDYFRLIGRIGGFYPPICFLTPRELINKAGYWNEYLTKNQDGEFFFRVFINAQKIVFDSNTYALYRIHSGENVSDLNSIEKAKSLINSWRIIEALSKTNLSKEAASSYLSKKKMAIYNEIKRNFPILLKEENIFFKDQRKEDNIYKYLLIIYTKIKRKVKNI